MKYISSVIIFLSVLFFANCKNENTTSKSSAPIQNLEQVYLVKGQKIAAATFATLSSNLQKAMQGGGVAKAIKYCNLSASPLVDSLESIHQAKIKRTSFKTRNPNNQATKKELEQLQIFQSQVDSGEDLKPVVKEIPGNKIAFYAPIHLMPLCQKCHGKIGETLLVEDYDLIQQLYTEDKAVGYVAGDWRGMWSITFPK